ncbi:MAG: TIGR02757 family protein [Bacteroidales bacterium]|nr:TIGR02757 family protein [Bacteroidales bacterium]
MNFETQDLKGFLDEKYDFYNRTEFIDSDPISIPHLFDLKEDIEISGFLAATLSWGNRKSILKSSKKLLELMDFQPFEFICNAKESDMKRFTDFVHRTFNGDDCIYFIQSLQNIYRNSGGLESVFSGPSETEPGIKGKINGFRSFFFQLPHLERTRKHVADPVNGAAAKRINMFLRWMVRNDSRGVDFGVWNRIRPSGLMCPLDVHTGNVARKLGLLHRKNNDWKSVEELTARLAEMDPDDPVKYDFALFGLGIYEHF